MTTEQQLFEDEVVRATDLNRGSGEVLNKAARHPVTIVRNDETFALMRRDVAAQWRKEASYAARLAELVWLALARSASATVGPEYEWLRAFEPAETLQIMQELMTAYRAAVRTGRWEDFDAILHEWSESGWAALNPDVEAAFAAEGEEVPLPRPFPAQE